MPELPEVETVRRGLESVFQDQVIQRVEVLLDRTIASPVDPNLFRLALQGSRVLHWERRGKYLLAELRNPDGTTAGTWGVHLRMTGQFLWDPAGVPCSHTRVRVWTMEGRELRFVDTRSFAQMWWIPPHTPAEMVISGLARLGPEPFDSAFTPAYLQAKMRGSCRPIKSALLDQALVAGVGNIYADESLFAAGIKPHTASGRLGPKRLERLRATLVDVLEISIGAGGTSFRDFRDLTGTNGNYGGMAWVYRRGGQPCRRCGALIRREKLAGRSSHWCPTCQR